MKKAFAALFVCLSVSTAAFGAVFVVPDDTELIHKSNAIVSGRIESAQSRSTAYGIETVYRLRVDRTLKGLAAGTIDVVSPGGVIGRRFELVSGAAHFDAGDNVLLFLTLHRGQWTTTDLTLGKFRYVTSTGGQSLLVRDAEDIVGFDKEMRTHVEKVRRQDEFLRFINDVVRGRGAAATQNYFVAPQETVALEPESKDFDVSANSGYASSSYAIVFNGVYPGRWPSSRMSSSTERQFYKNAAQHASGLGDGGVSQITSSLNAWTNDCPSAVNITYGGTSPNLKNTEDNVNVFVYNDPGDHIPGSWPGSSVIATAFMAGDNFHSFDSRNDWVSISDADVVVQNGLTGAESFMATALTHEVGHAIGLRHSNLHGNNTVCQASDECTSAAIMNSSVSSGTGYGFNLQPWDQNAIRAMYPGGSCTVNSVRYDQNGDGKADIFWRNGSTGWNWTYIMNGATQTQSEATNVAPVEWQAVGVGDFDGDGRADIYLRNNATYENYIYLMNGFNIIGGGYTHAPPAEWNVAGIGDLNGDGRSDVVWRNSVTGQNYVYFMNGTTLTSYGSINYVPDQAWQIVGVEDFNGDGRDDLLWRNFSTGQNWLYLMDGYSQIDSVPVSAVADLNWRIVGTADFNGDGKADILWRNIATGQNWMYVMNSYQVTSSVPVQYVTDLAAEVANTADYNGDGYPDILWRNTSTGQNWMFLMNGNAVLSSPEVNYVPDQNWQVIR